MNQSCAICSLYQNSVMFYLNNPGASWSNLDITNYGATPPFSPALVGAYQALYYLGTVTPTQQKALATALQSLVTTYLQDIYSLMPTQCPLILQTQCQTPPSGYRAF